MPRVTDIVQLYWPEQATLSIWHDGVAVEKLAELIGCDYARISVYLESLGVLMSDYPFVAYHRTEPGNFLVQIGCCTPSPLPDHGDLQSGSLPAGKVLSCIYRGHYMGILSVYREIETKMVSEHLNHRGPAYEYYYNDGAEEDYLTRIVVPVIQSQRI